MKQSSLNLLSLSRRMTYYQLTPLTAQHYPQLKILLQMMNTRTPQSSRTTINQLKKSQWMTPTAPMKLIFVIRLFF